MKDKQQLIRIYERTDGHCHLCQKKLSFTNYGKHSSKGAWHIEHSVARCNGGTDHLNNKYAACIKCNLKKGSKSTSSIRRENGHTRAPYSKQKKTVIKEENTAAAVVVCAGVGWAIGGPVGGFIGSVIGKIIGDTSFPGK